MTKLPFDMRGPIRVRYTNWRGEMADRHLMPTSLWFGSTEWHKEPQWLMKAVDLEKGGATRDFALKDMVPIDQEDPVRFLPPLPEDLKPLLREAVARVAAMSPAERAEMYAAQRHSVAIAEAGFGSDADEAAYRAAFEAGDAAEMNRLLAEGEERAHRAATAILAWKGAARATELDQMAEVLRSAGYRFFPPKVENVSLLPSALIAALDAEAEVWFGETDMAATIAHMSSDERSRQKLADFNRLCFVEGAYRGAMNVINGKTLQESLDEREGSPDSKGAA